MPKPSIVTYDGLPISSGGGHALRTRSPVTALDCVRHFISTCTDALARKEACIEVLTGENIPPEFSGPLIDRLTAELGKPKDQRSCGSRNIAIRWLLKSPQIDEYVTLIEKALPLPRHPLRLQAATVEILFSFRLLDPMSRIVLPGQDAADYGYFSLGNGQLLGASSLYARISERSTFSLFVNFPFHETSEQFFQTVDFVQSHLPFALSRKHWKQWQLSKNGRSYTGRKLLLPELRHGRGNTASCEQD